MQQGFRSVSTAARASKCITTPPRLIAARGQRRTMADLNIESTNINTAPGVELSAQQKTIVGSVLDLFAGRPSLAKLKLWSDTAVFEDPLTVAKGREQYEPQWYGLQKAFSEIERINHQVTSSGNPIEMTLKNRYVVKGLETEKTIDSKVDIHLGPDGKIEKVLDKWNGELPTGAVANAFRSLNAMTMPKIVGVPKDEQEDKAQGN